MSVFGADFFAGNRARLTQLFTGTAPIVLTANGLLQRASDSALPFHQDRSFWYMTGIDVPDIVLVIDKGHEYLIVPERSAVREAFDGALDHAELMAISGVTEVVPGKEGWRRLGTRLKRAQHVATLAAGPSYVDAIGIYTNPARAELIRRMKEVNSALELLDLRTHIARMRMVKQPVELAALQRAIDITAQTLKEVTRPARLAKYAHEYELEADITRGFRRRGAQTNAFDPIVAGGRRACTLHHTANDGPLVSGELVVLDVGAQYANYAADITRTVALNGSPSPRQRAVHAAVAAVQDFAFGQLRPGVVLKQYEKDVAQFLGEKLRELGLVKAIDDAAVRQYFPHATSHFLGLDTHDAGDYERPLEPGVVLTVEPGIYIPEEGIGVRIEDDVLITPDGCQNLSRHLPRDA